MPFVIETSNEVERYEVRWAALIACMGEGLPLHAELREILEAHQRERPLVEEPASKPEERVAQIRAKVEALVTRYGGTLQRITVWFAHLQEHLQVCQANLDNVPLAGAISGVHDSISRAMRDRMPTKPAIQLDDPESLEARAKYLRDVQDVVAQSEGYPRLVGNAIAALHETFKVFARELAEARFHGQRSNTSAFQPEPPRHPLVGVVATPQKPATVASDYAWLTN